MYCAKCGNKLGYNQTSCDICHCSEVIEKETNDKVNYFMVVISFILPFIGIILWLLNKGDKPKTSLYCLIGSLASSLFAISIYIANVI